MRVPQPLTIRFIHEAPTPHNNYLLDAVASEEGVVLHRHFLFRPTEVPGRPWKGMGIGEVQIEHIHVGHNRRFDWPLLKLALFDRRCVFFVVGWESPSLILTLFVLGLLRRPLLMWDDGATDEALRKIRQWWKPKQAIKRLMIALINRTPGTYFHTGQIKAPSMVALGIRTGKLASLPFFVKPGGERTELRAIHDCAPPKALILAGGRLIRQKGFDIFVEALAGLRQEVPAGWKAVLIGSGPEADLIHARVKELGIGHLVDFITWAEPDVFAAYIHTCDIFAAPARFDHFPTTVIAAMQAGAAVVGTEKVGSASEFIASGVNGVIVPAESAQALAAALARLVTDATLRKRLGAAGQVTLQAWPVQRGARMIVAAAERARQSCAQ